MPPCSIEVCSRRAVLLLERNAFGSVAVAASVNSSENPDPQLSTAVDSDLGKTFRQRGWGNEAPLGARCL
jgi:hypothetical protein